MNAHLNYALRETLWSSKWVMLLSLFVFYIIFCIDIIFYIINNSESIGLLGTIISLGGMIYSIGCLIVCMFFIIQLMKLERQYR